MFFQSSSLVCLINYNLEAGKCCVPKKLNEDAKSTYNKWKKSVLIIGADLTKKICDCNIF